MDDKRDIDWADIIKAACERARRKHDDATIERIEQQKLERHSVAEDNYLDANHAAGVNE